MAKVNLRYNVRIGCICDVQSSVKDDGSIIEIGWRLEGLSIRTKRIKLHVGTTRSKRRKTRWHIPTVVTQVNSHRHRAKIERKLLMAILEEEARAWQDGSRRQSPGTMIPIDGGPRCIRAYAKPPHTATTTNTTTTTTTTTNRGRRETSGCTGNRTIASTVVRWCSTTVQLAAVLPHLCTSTHAISIVPPLSRSSSLFPFPLRPSSPLLARSLALLPPVYASTWYSSWWRYC